MHIPTWLYHAKQPARIFDTQESADDALADGWVMSPADLPTPEEATDKEALFAKAAELDIKIDKRWSVKRLQDEIALAENGV